MNILRDTLRSWLPMGRWTEPGTEVVRETQQSDALPCQSGLPKSGLSTRWLHPARSKQALIEVAGSWQRAQAVHDIRVSPADEDELGQIQSEVWSATCHLVPMPDIALATLCSGVEGETAQPVGVLAGNHDYGANHFFISHLALHPALRATRVHQLWSGELGLAVCDSLIEATIDLSHGLGARGWVAVSPREEQEAAWMALKFFRQDDFTFRRMGYFVS